MFRIKNNSDDPQAILIPGLMPIAVTVGPGEFSDELDDHYRKFFNENEVEWAAISPCIPTKSKRAEKPVVEKPVEVSEKPETTTIESIGKPVIEKPKTGRKGTS